MINNPSKSDGAHFSVRFLISHRSIKIGAILIAILILAAMAVPARSLETIKEGVKIELPLPDRAIPIEPFPELQDSMSKQMRIDGVFTLGIYEFEEKIHGWAIVRWQDADTHPARRLPQGTPPRLLYIPDRRLQSLLEANLLANGFPRPYVYAHPIVKPEGWVGTEEYEWFEVTSGYIYSEPPEGGIFDE